MRSARLAILLVILVLMGSAAPLGAQASGHVPFPDPAYAELQALVGAGLVQDEILGQRPHSRVAFARMVREARRRVEGGAALGRVPRVAEALERLEARFARERAWLCAEDGSCPEVAPALRVTEARLDATRADSPGRPVRSDILPNSAVDATLNPLLQGNDGRTLVDGWTAGAEVGVELQLGRALTAVARPRVWSAGPQGGDTETDGTAHDLYLRGVFGKLAVEVGRRHVFEGHGRDAGVILSRNPRGLDLVRLASARPFRLPWILDALGPTRVSGLIADMGEDRDTPGSVLIVLRGSVRPHPNFEVGGTLLNHQGGEGSPEADAWTRFSDVFLWGFPGISLKEISDKVSGLDLRLTLPDPGLDAYLEWSATDFNLARFGEMLGDEAAWVGGVRLGRLGPGGRTTLWIEGHRAGVRPHTHHQYTSGLTLDGRVLGDPLGPLATGLSVGLDWSGETHALTLSGTWEEYSGDDYRNTPGPDFEWILVSDNPDETRLRGQAEWSWQDGATGLRPSARVAVEGVSRFGFTGEDRTNAVAQVRISYIW